MQSGVQQACRFAKALAVCPRSRSSPDSKRNNRNGHSCRALRARSCTRAKTGSIAYHISAIKANSEPGV
eukprot:873754-Alexandrium_andersonii.AAC.1